MLLYYEGHGYRYASEQILLVLFPQEKPEYPPEGAAFPPRDGRPAARIRLSRSEKTVTAVTLILRDGRTGRGTARAELPEGAAALQQDSLSQRVLKLSFYRGNI